MRALFFKECWYEWSVPGAQKLGQCAFKGRSDPWGKTSLTSKLLYDWALLSQAVFENKVETTIAFHKELLCVGLSDWHLL